MILVLGRTQLAALIGEQLTEAAGEYWRDIGRGVERLAAVPHRFHAVLAARAEVGGAAMQVLVGGDGSRPPLVWLDTATGSDGTDVDHALPVCGLERDAGGGCRMRCALAEAQSRPAQQPALAAALGSRPVGFVYSAPVDREDLDRFR